MDDFTPRQPKGRPTGGEFAATNRTEAGVALAPRVRAARAADIQSFIDLERTNNSTGKPTWGSAADSLQQTPDDVLAAALGMTGDSRDARLARFRTGFAVRAEREGLHEDLPATARRESDSDMLSADYIQMPAIGYVDDRLDGFTGVNHFSRADYAEVGETGIAYGIHLNPDVIGAIVAGDLSDYSSEDDYEEAMAVADPEIWSKATTFFSEEYGADLTNDGGSGLTIEFFVEYEPGGAAMSTIEYMGDRVEHETKLLAALNEYEYGNSMTRKFAERLGYRYQAEPGEIFVGKWVRD